MAELDAFQPDPGLDSGRVQPDASDVGIRVAGSWLFVLGRDLPGWTALLAPGDTATLSQSVDFTGLNLVAFQPRTRPPSSTPAGYAWKAKIAIASVGPSAERTLDGSTPMDWDTWSLNVSKVAGVATLQISLTFTGPTPTPPASPLVEAEIPAFYVEAVTTTAPSGPMLINAQPDAGQGISTGSPPLPSTSIVFDLTDFGSSGIKQSSIRVVVNGLDAVLVGLPQPGWSVVYTNPSADTKHVVVTPDAPFSSAQTVAVSVYATTNGNAPLAAQPTSWTFQIADVIPPQITAVSATATNTVRVVWDEAVVATSATGAHDAMNASLYTLEPQITVGGLIPAVTPAVVSVSIPEGTTNTFDLTTDVELSPGITYQLAANGVDDLQGNHAISVALFSAFVPPAPAGRNFNLWRKLSRRSRDNDTSGDLERLIRCLQEVFDLVLYSIDKWSDILDIDVAPERFVDVMLVDLGNPFPFVLTEIDKRRLGRLLVPIYKKKGSPDAIIDAIRFFMGLDVTITTFSSEGYCILGVSELGVDWILGPGTSYARYSFRVISSVVLDDEQRDRIRIIANILKPAHTHLIEIVEPSGPPPAYDPLVLGVSRLGDDWLLH